MVNYKKIERMKEKRLYWNNFRVLSGKDVEEIKDVFFFPENLIDNNIQLLLVPFVAYNISFPFETTTFTMYVERSETAFGIVGRLSRIFIPIRTSFRDKTSGKYLRRLLRPEEIGIRKELEKAMKTVCDDLEVIPETLWYNQISLVKTDLLDLENYSDKLHDSLAIIGKKMRVGRGNKILIPHIKLPTLDDPSLQLESKFLNLKFPKIFS